MMTGYTGTDLVYNILEQQLVGEIDGVSISAYAVSGGRAGSKTVGAVNPFLANNPYATGVKKKGDKNNAPPGGPIVIGRYSLKTHEKKADMIRLLPQAGNHMRGRSGFLIHGRGPRGSDGCIVPTDFHVVLLLYRLVKAREQAGQEAPSLAVVAIGDFRALDIKLDGLRHTA
jgi:hypothetical protein